MSTTSISTTTTPAGGPGWATVVDPDEVDASCVAYERRSSVPVLAFPDAVGEDPWPVEVYLAEYHRCGEVIEGPLVNVLVPNQEHPGTTFTVRQARQLRAALDELLGAYDAAVLQGLAVSR